MVGRCDRVGHTQLKRDRLLKKSPEGASVEAMRREANEVIARVKERVETGLAAGG